jgi:catechol 2,3-dioxygenase-like lactoylglutathione lyase family enzyme
MFAVKWDHVHLRSPDVDATAAWFVDMLGAQLVKNPGRYEVTLGGAQVFVSPQDERDSLAPNHPHLGLDHIGLAVSDIDDVIAELKAKGVEVTRGPLTIRNGVRVCFLRGPENMSVELLDRDERYVVV